MSDNKRSRLKREPAQSETKKLAPDPKKSTRDTSRTSSERKPREVNKSDLSGPSKVKSEIKKEPVINGNVRRKPAQSRDVGKPDTPGTSKSKIDTGRKPIIAAAGNSTRKPVIAASTERKPTVQRSLAKKVTLEATPRSKVNIYTGSKTGEKKISGSKEKIVPKSEEKKISKINKQSVNAKHESRSPSRLSRDRTRTRTLSPGESKLVHMAAAAAAAANKTVSPEPPDVSQDEQIEDDYYESDFESDFESCTSSSESEDEGAPIEMSTLPRPASRPLHPEIQVSNPKHDLSIKPTPTLVQEPKVTFKEIQKQKIDEKETVLETRSVGINFANARQRQAQMKAAERAQSRGVELLSMIKLDTVTFTLLNQPPSKYDILMSPYGVQAQTQTGSGKLEEEVQTEKITTSDHWTQHPPCAQPLIQGLQATGPIDDSKKEVKWPSLDFVRLEKFLSRALEVVLAVMNEEERNDEKSMTSNLGLNDLAKVGVTLGSEVNELLVKRPANLINFGESSQTIFTLHPSTSIMQEDALSQDTVLVWNLGQSSRPSHVLGSRSPISSICQHPDWNHLLFAGTHHGSVCLWDLQEAIYLHPTIQFDHVKLYIRSPSFTTALMKDAHTSPVIKILATSCGGHLVSVDESGLAITWSIVKVNTQGHDLQGSQVTWGSYRLVPSQTHEINIPDDALVTDSVILGDHRLLIALDTGQVLSSSLVDKLATKTYQPSQDYAAEGNTILALSPYNKKQFVVRDGGGIRLHDTHSSLPIWTSHLSSANHVSWGHAGLVGLTSGLVKLWHVPDLVLTCNSTEEICFLAAHPQTNQLVVATRGGGLHVLSIIRDLCKEIRL